MTVFCSSYSLNNGLAVAHVCNAVISLYPLTTVYTLSSIGQRVSRASELNSIQWTCCSKASSFNRSKVITLQSVCFLLSKKVSIIIEMP